MAKKITIICPMRNEVNLIEQLCKEVTQLVRAINTIGLSVEVIFIDNASTDETFNLLLTIGPHSTAQNKYRYIKNERDIGLQASLMTSMDLASGDALVILHSDLEDPPQLILEFISEWEKGSKVVVGVMKNRSDPMFYQLTSRFFYKFLQLTSDNNLLANFTDFFLIDKKVYKEIATRPRSNQYIRGIISDHYGVDKRIYYDRGRRKAGKSNFNFAKRYEVALDAIFAFGGRIPRFFSVGSMICSITTTIGFFSLLAYNFIFQGLNQRLVLFLFCIMLLSYISLITSLVFEVCFRIYNFLLNTTKSYSFQESIPHENQKDSFK
jgi:glycosyltransferase involved in cell wall biosynthesis